MLAAAESRLDNASVAPERRRWPRFDMSCNGLIRLSDTLTFRCQLRNLSMSAAQVLCDARYALLVHPRGGPVGAAGARDFDLSLAFAISGIVRSFMTRGRAIYCEAIGNSSQRLLGLEFVALEVGARQLLANYLGDSRD
jgi:hypothetical protein